MSAIEESLKHMQMSMNKCRHATDGVGKQRSQQSRRKVSSWSDYEDWESEEINKRELVHKIDYT